MPQPSELRLEVMEQVVTCESCPLHADVQGPVFMSGPTPARIAIVGEAPGEQEDKQGEPFIGPAGRKLRELLEGAGIDPTTVAFVNTVSCWPRGTPTWDHIHACSKNKIDQLALVDPEFVVPVGKVALKAFVPHLDIKHGRARPWKQDNRIHFATYHPAAALRNGNYEEAMERDLARLVELIAAPDWQKFIPDTCSGCANHDVVWFEDSGLGWCEVHLPAHIAPLYRERMALVAADLASARASQPGS